MRLFAIFCVCVGLSLISAHGVSGQAVGTTTLESVSASGQIGNGWSEYPSFSEDGDLIVFSSAASNLVPGDTNGHFDVFVRNRLTGQIERVSVGSNGEEGHGGVSSSGSYMASMSWDGRFVSFMSEDTTLVPDDDNGLFDYFVHDRQTHQTSRIGQAATGDHTSMSADGRYVAFSSRSEGPLKQIYVYDMNTGGTRLVSKSNAGEMSNGDQEFPNLSADGRFVSFTSFGDNLVANDTNMAGDIFVHDLITNLTTRVSVSSFGIEADGRSTSSWLSADGRYVVFDSSATNLVASDMNGSQGDVFVHDRITGITSLVSVNSTGGQGNGSSGNEPRISSDGRFVSFSSHATNLVAEADTNGDADLFVHDRLTQETIRVSVSSSGAQANAPGVSNGAPFSPDGRFVGFWSQADNLVAGDTNGTYDVFARQFREEEPESTPPTITGLTGPIAPLALGTSASVSAHFTDPNAGDTHTCVFSWHDGTSTPPALPLPTVNEMDGSGSCTAAHLYAAAGVYPVEVTVTDSDNLLATAMYSFVVIYDPAAGFVTGAGWINSPAGAYRLDGSLTGKASFGFVSKYQQGANTPSGQTQFQFRVGDLNFHSQVYEWLVVAGPKAQFKGTGTINGFGTYQFLLTATDGQSAGGGGADGFRIKIWDAAGVIYDNVAGSDEFSQSGTQPIGGGSVVIHKH